MTSDCLQAEPSFAEVVIASPTQPGQDFWVFLGLHDLEKAMEVTRSIQQNVSTIYRCQEQWLVCFSVRFELFKQGLSSLPRDLYGAS